MSDTTVYDRLHMCHAHHQDIRFWHVDRGMVHPTMRQLLTKFLVKFTMVRTSILKDGTGKDGFSLVV